MSADLISRKALINILEDVEQDGLLKVCQIIELLEDQPKAYEDTGWIPVEERLPGIGRKVLVSFRYTGWQPVIAFLSEEHRWLMLQGMKGYNDVTHDVSAWMPMPKTYHPKSEDWKENLLKKFDKRT